MKLTKAQLNMFWSAFAKAWKEHCGASGQDPDDAAARDAWRRGLIREAAGAASLKDVGRGADFDRVMLRLAAEAGDYGRAAHLETALAGRIRHRCADCVRQICEIDGRAGLDTDEARWRYVSGVAAQAYRGRAWLDIPEDDLGRIFMMLDTHRRRLLKRAGWRGGRGNPHEPLAFALGRCYARDGGRVVLAEGGACVSGGILE